MKLDKILLITIILISLIGLMMVYSSSSIWAEYRFNDSFHYLKYQSIFFLIGLFIMLFISKIDYHFYYKYANYFLVISLILLILVLIPGIGSVRNGSRSWFGIGSLGIQPSEAVKLSLIIFTSKYLSKNDNQTKYFFKDILPLLIVLSIFFALIMLQPDLGTDLIIALSVLSIVFVSGTSLKFFSVGGIIGIALIAILIIIAPYRLNRITSFLNPWSDPLGTGFQTIQSLFAIAPGGLMGLGYLNSIQKHFYLPEPQTDFIFSIIMEEFGFVGALVVILLFIIFLYRSLKISINCEEAFPKYLVFGLAFQIIFQMTYNAMIITSLLPITGITLPFISYGGSSLLVSMVSIGIILNISRNV